MAYAQGIFQVKNPKKYVGHKPPIYRSGWEWAFMQFLDNSKHVLQWASEPIRIPYRNPLTGKPTNYVPDFFVLYQNANGKQVAECVEIKPKKETLIESKRASVRNRAVVAVNHAKWEAANAWCRQNGITFRVITEDHLFVNGGR
jgi:hypothetical protein